MATIHCTSKILYLLYKSSMHEVHSRGYPTSEPVASLRG